MRTARTGASPARRILTPPFEEDHPTTDPGHRPEHETARDYASPAARVGGAGSRRGPLVAMTWAAGVVAVVLVGVGGRLGADQPRPSPSSSAAPVAVATPSPSTVESVVTLLEPAPPPAAVTGIPLWVRGRAPAAATEVLLILREDEIEVARQSARTGRTGRFAAVFTLLPPRPERHLTVTATALGDDVTLGEAEQPVLVAPLHRVAAAASPRPRLGEDGVLGSRGVDLAELAGGGTSPGGPDLPTGWPWRPSGRLAEQVYR